MRIVLGGVMIAVAVAALFVLSRDLLPPKTLRFAAGSEGGGYWQIAQMYRDILGRDGIDVEVIATAGSVENAELLEGSAVDVGLMQGGVARAETLEALGAIFVEPFFVFARSASAIPSNAADWRGLRLASGAPGSGTRAAVEAFEAALGLDPDANAKVPVSGQAAAEALLAGEVDVAIFVAPIHAGYLKPLFASPDVGLLALDNIKALARRLDETRLIELPSGAVSLSPTVPAEGRMLLAMEAVLVAEPTLHPSLVDRLVEAAREIHSKRDVITEAGTFPTMEGVSMRADVYARDLIASGPSPLQQYLPYWVVAQINRFAILLLPIIFLLIPLLRLAPGIYSWRMRARVYRHYNQIRMIEQEAGEVSDPGRLNDLDDQLAEIDREIAALRLPLPYRDYAYTARLHVDLVRKRIAAQLGDSAVARL